MIQWLYEIEMMKKQIVNCEQPLRLVGGKFMRGDVEEAPEIGNSEQIALLQRIEREASEREQQARDGNLDVEISVRNIRYEAVCKVECICGEDICETDGYGRTDDFEELEYPDEFDGETITCEACGRRYEINGCHAKLLIR